MHRVVFARRARLWLRNQTEYLLGRGPYAAEHLAERIDTAVRLLSRFPHSGALGPTPGTRRLVAVPYVLTYREATPDVIVILDIRHGRQRGALPPEELG